MAADYTPTDDEASTLLGAVEAEPDAGRKEEMVGLLGNYRKAKTDAGLVPFAPDPAVERQRRETVEGLYAGLDGIDEKIPLAQREEFSAAVNATADKNEAKARMVNQSWVIANRPGAAGQVDADWNGVKLWVAKHDLGIDATELTDTQFYSHVSAHLTKKKAENEMLTEALAGIVQEAGKGSDFMSAWKKTASGISSNPAWDPNNHDRYRQVAQKVFEETQAKLAPIRTAVELGKAYYKLATGPASGAGVKEGDAIRPKTREEMAADMSEVEAAREAFSDELARLPQGQQETALNYAVGGAVDASPKPMGAEGSAGGIEKAAVKLERAIGEFPSDVGRFAMQGARSAGAMLSLARAGFYGESAAGLNMEQAAMQRTEMNRRIDQGLTDAVDPIKSKNRLAQGVYDAMQSIPYMVAASSGAGLPLTIMAMAEDARAKFVDLGVPPEEAATLGLAVGVPQAAIERLQASMFFHGKLPGFEKWLTKAVGTKLGLAKKMLAVAGIETVQQNAEEFLQDITVPIYQDIGSALSDSIPDVKWLGKDGELAQFTSGRVDTFFALLPMVLIGTGSASLKEASYGRQYLQNKTMLKAAGFTEAAAEAISQEAHTGDVGTAQELVQNGWTDPAQRPAATKEQESAAAAEDLNKHYIFNSEEQMRAFEQLDEEMRASWQEHANPQGARAVRQEDGSWAVVDAQGVIFDKAQTADAAIQLVGEIDRASSASSAVVMDDMIDYFKQRGRGGDIVQTGDSKTLADEVEAGRMSEDQAKSVVELYVQLGNLPAGTHIDQARIYGESEQRYNAKTRIYDYVTRLHDGADPLVLVEEETEGYFKSMLDSGELTIEQVEAWQQAMGVKIDKKPDAKMQRRAAVEFFSKYAQAYFTGKIQTDQAAWNSVPMTLKRWLAKMQKVFAEIFQLAHDLIELDNAGKLPEDFKTHLARSVGLDDAFIERRMRDEERAAAAAAPGEELLDWVKGRLPHPEGYNGVLAGELRDMYDGLTTEVNVAERGVDRIEGGQVKRARKGYKRMSRSAANAFFAPKDTHVDLDRLREAANEAGFKFDTPAELLAAVDQSFAGNLTHAWQKEDSSMAVRKKTDQSGDLFGADMPFNLDGGQAVDATGAVDQEDARRTAVAKQAKDQGRFNEVDRAEYDRLQDEMKALGVEKFGSPEYNALWQKSEEIKNRNQGMPPGEEPAENTMALRGPAFYSRLTRTVEQSDQAKASGAQWKAMIRNSKLGVNKDEFALVGVEDLEDGKTYTKQEVLDYLSANEVKVENVTLGKHKTEATMIRFRDLPDTVDKRQIPGQEHMSPNDWIALVDGEYAGTGDESLSESEARENIDMDRQGAGLGAAGSDTHFQAYTLPGAKTGSYRETLLTVPRDAVVEKGEQALIAARKAAAAVLKKHDYLGFESMGQALRAVLDHDDWDKRWDVPDAADKAAVEAFRNAKDTREAATWKDGHSQYAEIHNPIVRLRYNERAMADGKRMLFVEEVQAPQKREFDKMPMLFQKNWREIGFKWALRQAVEGGFDSIGWTTGDQQAERYDLSKQVEGISYFKREGEGYFIKMLPKGRNAEWTTVASRIPAEEIEQHVGKEVAQKIINGDGKVDERSGATFLDNVDMKIGGEGLRKLYDQDFRNVVNGLPAVKKFGQKVGTAKIDTDQYNSGMLTQVVENGKVLATYDQYDDAHRQRLAKAWIDYNRAEHPNAELREMKSEDTMLPVHALTITPEMRASVEEGQPTFSLRQEKTKAFKTWKGKAELVKSGEPHTFVSGKPVVVEAFHGTTHDFSRINTAKANIENDFGRAFYASNAPGDVEANYAGEGPDLTGRIERRSEMMEADAQDMPSDELMDKYGLSSADAKLLNSVPKYGSPAYEKRRAVLLSMARKELTGHGGATMKVYIRLNNPLVLGGEGEGYWDADLDEDTGNIGGQMGRFIDALNNVVSRYDDASVPYTEHFTDGAKPSELIKALRSDAALSSATDPETGDIASSQIIADAIQQMGYDGVVDGTVNEKFGSERKMGKQMQGMDENTVHIIAFDNASVKSATGNRGTFDENNPDLTASIGPMDRPERVQAAIRVRAISIRVDESPTFAKQVKKLVGEMKYEVRGMTVNEKEARKVIEKHNGELPALLQLLHDPTQTMHPATKVALAFFMAEAANKAKDYKSAADIAKQAAMEATAAGQGVNEFKRWSIFDQPETCQQLLQTELDRENAKRRQREPALDAVVTVYADVQKEAHALLKKWIDEINGFTAESAKPVDVSALPEVTFALSADQRATGIVGIVAKMLKESGAEAVEKALVEKYGEKVQPHLTDIFIEAQKSLTTKKPAKDKKFKTRQPVLPEEQIERSIGMGRGRQEEQADMDVIAAMRDAGLSEEQIERTLAENRNRLAGDQLSLGVDKPARPGMSEAEIEARLADARAGGGRVGAQGSLSELPEFENRLLDHILMQLEGKNVRVVGGFREQIAELLNQHGLKASEDDVKRIVGAGMLLPDMTPAQAEKLAGFAERIASTPMDSFERAQQTMELFSYVHDTLKPYDLTDVAFGLWYANVLSSLITSARNVTGNAGMLFLDQAAETIFRNPAAYWPYLAQMSQAVQTGLETARPQAANTAKTGQEGFQRSRSLDDERRQGVLESKTAPMETVRSISRVATRFLSIQDLFFANTAYEMKARQLAWDEAQAAVKAGKLKPEQVEERVALVLNATTDQIQTFADRAAVEWENLDPAVQADYTKASWVRRRTAELRLFERDHELVSRSLDFAQKVTLDYPPEGLMGVVMGGLSGIFTKIENAAQDVQNDKVRLLSKGAAKYGRTHVIPFMRVPVNVFNRALDYGPIGFGRALMDSAGIPVLLATGKTRTRSADERSDLLKRATLGTLALLPLALFCRPPGPDDEPEETPWLQIHGAGSGTPNTNLAQNGPKYRPYSLEIRVAGNQSFIDYRMFPLAPWLAALGTMHDRTRYSKAKAMDEKSMLAQGWILAQALKEGFLAGSPITSLRELSEAAAENNPMSERAINRTLARGTVGVVSNVAIPLAGLWRSLDQLAGGERNTRDTLLAANMAELPVAARMNLASIDVLGDPLTTRAGIGWLADWSKMETPESRIYRAFAEKDVSPTDISRYQSKLTPEQYYEFAKVRGQYLKGYLLNADEEGITGLDRLNRFSDKARTKDDESPAKKYLDRLSLAATRRALHDLGQSPKPKAGK